MSLRLARAALEAIHAEAARAYPEEACGALIGSAWGGRVIEALALPNREAASPRTRFAIAPADYLSAEAAAESRGARLIGFWHSHPDHPAQPSATDRERAWEGLLTVVVAVDEGRPGDVTAWSVPGPGEPFAEVALLPEQA